MNLLLYLCLVLFLVVVTAFIEFEIPLFLPVLLRIQSYTLVDRQFSSIIHSYRNPLPKNNGAVISSLLLFSSTPVCP